MNFKKELPIMVIVLLPFAYLAYIWNQLPQQVPVHWNIRGEIDRYGDKTELIWIPVVLPLLVYLILLIAPKIDPKNKLNKMGNKLHTIKFLLTTLMSVLALFIIYSAKKESLANPNYLILVLGLLYMVLGNYFKTIRPNYFIGIRTPWTLENETVWKQTHKLGGKAFFIGGLITVISSLILEEQANLIVFLGLTGIIAVLLVVYSYIKYKEEQKKNGIKQHTS